VFVFFAEIQFNANSRCLPGSSYIAQRQSDFVSSYQNSVNSSATITSKLFDVKPSLSAAINGDLPVSTYNDSGDLCLLDADSLLDGSTVNTLSGNSCSLPDYNMDADFATAYGAHTNYSLGGDFPTSFDDADANYNLGADLATTVADGVPDYSRFCMTGPDFNRIDMDFSLGSITPVSSNSEHRTVNNQALDLGQTIFHASHVTNKHLTTQHNLLPLPIPSTRSLSAAGSQWSNFPNYVPKYSDLPN